MRSGARAQVHLPRLTAVVQQLLCLSHELPIAREWLLLALLPGLLFAAR